MLSNERTALPEQSSHEAGRRSWRSAGLVVATLAVLGFALVRNYAGETPIDYESARVPASEQEGRPEIVARTSVNRTANTDGSSESVTEVPTSSAPATGPSSSSAIPKSKFIPKNDIDLARLFYSAPMKVDAGKLLGSDVTNPTKIEPTSAQIEALEALLSKHKEAIRSAEISRGAAQHDVLKALRSANALVEIKESMLTSQQLLVVRQRADNALRALQKRTDVQLPLELDGVMHTLLMSEMEAIASEVVPGARAFMREDGRLFVATEEQLKSANIEREFVFYLKSAFLTEALAFLTSEGFAPSDNCQKIAVQFYLLSGRSSVPK